jgi:hypothetical protein
MGPHLTGTPMRELRLHPRIPMKCIIKIEHPSIGEMMVETRDISDGGVFIVTPDQEIPPVGSIVTGQVQGMGDAAPILKMEVVREEPIGLGLKFIDPNH